MYKQLAKRDCGTAALTEITGRSYLEIAEHLGLIVPIPDSIISDLKDNPYNHFAALNKMGIGYKVVPFEEIGAQRTMVLIHFGKDFVEQTERQHWIIVEGKTEDNFIVQKGNGTVEFWHKKDLKNLYYGGFPNCAYIIVPYSKSDKLRWWQKIIAWVSFLL